jgi:hypothetical protein
LSLPIFWLATIQDLKEGKISIGYPNSRGFFSKTKIGDDIQQHIASLKSQDEKYC